MDKVILCEGKNDVILLSRIHEECNGDYEYDQFINQEAELNQSVRLTHHQTGDQFEYLYKGEGGRSKVISIFVREVVNLCNLDFEIFLFVDLDGEPLSVFEAELGEKLVETHGNRVKVDFGPVRPESGLLIVPCEVLIRDSVVEEFDLLAYDESLEDITGIYDGEDISNKISKINNYISTNQNHIELISETIFS